MAKNPILARAKAVLAKETHKPAGDPNWDSKSAEYQKQYLEDHPRSKRKLTALDGKKGGAGKGDKESDEVKKTAKMKPIVDYHPDVEEKDADGVTKAARVGIPGRQTPVPPPIPRLPNLNEHEKAAEEKFASDYEKHPEKMASDFLDMVVSGKKPPTFGTDDAKMLTAEWCGEPGEDRSARRATLNTALHQTANAVAKKAFTKHLDTLKKGDSILVTVGGCGAGKGYSLGNVDVAKEAASKAQAVWDSAGDQNATENPWIQEEAEKRGLKVTYAYVHADPEVSWADPGRGVIKRANNPADGRMVDAHVFADSYALGAQNHKAFAEKHKDNPNASFIYIDSAGKPPTLTDKMPEDATKVDRKKLAKFAVDALEKADAPKHIKEGGSAGTRIWGSPDDEKPKSDKTDSKKKEGASVTDTNIKIKTKKLNWVLATDSKKDDKKEEKKTDYSWDQYEKDEAERLEKLSKHPSAGKYGGGYKGPFKGGATKDKVTKKQKDSFAFLKRLGIKAKQIQDKEVRKQYEDWLKVADKDEPKKGSK